MQWVSLFIMFKGGEPVWSDKPVQEQTTAVAEWSTGLCVRQQQTGEQQLDASKTQSQVELSHLRYPGTDCLGQGSNLRAVLKHSRHSAAVGGASIASTSAAMGA